MQQMIERLFHEKQHELPLIRLGSKSLTPFEASPILHRNCYNWFIVNEIPVILLPGQKSSTTQMRTFKVALATDISCLKCAVCNHKDCVNCHYQFRTEYDKYTVLDDYFIFCKSYCSAVENKLFAVARMIWEEIKELERLGLPEYDEKLSQFPPQRYIAMKTYVIKAKRVGDCYYCGGLKFGEKCARCNL